jgi:hypothetical protein
MAAAKAAGAQTCVTIDEPHDMLGPADRTAAVLLVEKQFELAGHRPGSSACAATYTLSHIRLGTTIVVTMTGPGGSREGTALGLDDLPAVYSQLVRSLTTGQPMGSLAVLDRGNVSAVQDLPARRVQPDGYWHARVGYGGIFGPSTQPAASFGFGYRAEFDRLGVDLSFLNMQRNDAGSYYGRTSSTMSLVKLEGLYFTHPEGNRSAYFGGGLSYGRTEVQITDASDLATGGFPVSGRGAGLQGELTAGYEIARVTAVRLFTQVDVTLPFYDVTFEHFTYPQAPPANGRFSGPTVTTERKYAPSVAVSVGLGWQRRHR